MVQAALKLPDLELAGRHAVEGRFGAGEQFVHIINLGEGVACLRSGHGDGGEGGKGEDNSVEVHGGRSGIKSVRGCVVMGDFVREFFLCFCV